MQLGLCVLQNHRSRKFDMVCDLILRYTQFKGTLVIRKLIKLTIFKPRRLPADYIPHNIDTALEIAHGFQHQQNQNC